MNSKQKKIKTKNKESINSKNKEHFIKIKETKEKNRTAMNKKRRAQFKSETKINLDIKTDLISNINKINKESQTIVAEKRINTKKINSNKKSKENKSVNKKLNKPIKTNPSSNSNSDSEKNDKDKKDNKVLFPNKNIIVKVTNPSQKSSKHTNPEKLLIVDKFCHTLVHKSKETLSTNLDTISTEKNKNEENLEEVKNAMKAVFTPIPSLMKKNSKAINQEPNLKDVEKAIQLRRQQYNEYLKSLKKPKHKPKPKPKVYDLDNVIFIQKMFKAYEVKDVNQTVTRLKINLCVTELFCLIFNHVFKHARRRITFYMFKNYYHDPFTNIFNEVDFSDKLAMKLSDTYYNFNNFFRHK